MRKGGETAAPGRSAVLRGNNNSAGVGTLLVAIRLSRVLRMLRRAGRRDS
jgi:hypothetical protein